MRATGVTATGGGRAAVPWIAMGGLTVALVLAPGAVATWTSGAHLTMANLPTTVTAGFGRWVASGRAGPDPQLAAASSFWAAFHVVKAVLAAGLLVVVSVLGRRRWTGYVRAASGWRRVVSGAIGASLAVVAAVLLLVVVANVQGVVAPLSSVLTLLPVHGSGAVEQVRTALAAGRPAPVIAMLVDDFRLYHAALVACLVPVVLGGVATTVLLWVRRARTPGTDRRHRRLLAVVATIVPAFVLLLGVVLAANMSTVMDTAPALAAFLDGSGG